MKYTIALVAGSLQILRDGEVYKSRTLDQADPLTTFLAVFGRASLLKKMDPSTTIIIDDSAEYLFAMAIDSL